MVRTAAIMLMLVSLCLAACAGTMHDSDDDEDRFRSVAVSWVGASLDNMIAVWGEPSQRVMEAEPGRNGLVLWRNTWSAGTPTLAIDGYRCIVEARYAPDRTILRIDTISHNCDTQSSDLLDRLAYRAN